MRIYALTCSTCGAPIEVPARRRVTECPYCRTPLVIVRDNEGAHTEPSGATGSAANPLRVERDDPRAAELRRRIAELDEQWQTDRMRFIKPQTGGRHSIYTGADAAFTLAFVGASAVVAPLMTWAFGLPWPVALIGAAPLGYALWIMDADRAAGRDYRTLRQTYEQERNVLFEALHALSE
ncbi:MAG: hypothetical protein GC159_19685 [Phycisphaera sp.]|nr:hypothetical protein [Phycisphaera sp.]